MSIPSFDEIYKSNWTTKPRICILEVRKSDESDTAPIAWLIIERQENCRLNEDGSIREASVRLTYECIRAGYATSKSGKGYFTAGYFCGYDGNPRVSLISETTYGGGAVFLDLPGLEGLGIGTYLMNEIVKWAKQWPNATVSNIELGEAQAKSEDNKLRRNRFYEQFGLVFIYADSEKKSGRSENMTAADLTPIDEIKGNLLELSVDDFIMQLLDEKESMKREQKSLNSRLNFLQTEMKSAKSRPFKWVAQQMAARVFSYLGLFIFVLVIGVVIFR